MSIAHQLSGCVARILAAPKTEIESFMPFYQAESSQQNPFNKGRFRKEPWGLICSVIGNALLQAKLLVVSVFYNHQSW